MNERELLMHIYRTCSDKNHWSPDKSYDKGWNEAYDSIKEIIDSWVDARKQAKIDEKKKKLEKLKGQLKSLYCELERALDSGNAWSANEVQEEIGRLQKSIEASYAAIGKRNKPIGRKLRIEL